MNRTVVTQIKDLFKLTFYDEQENAFDNLVLSDCNDLICICEAVRERAEQKKKEIYESKEWNIPIKEQRR